MIIIVDVDGMPMITHGAQEGDYRLCTDSQGRDYIVHISAIRFNPGHELTNDFKALINSKMF